MVCLDRYRIEFITHCLPQHETVTLTSLATNTVGHNKHPKCRIFPKFQKPVSDIFVEMALEAPVPTCIQEQVLCSCTIVRVDEPEESDKQLEVFVRQWWNNIAKLLSLRQRNGFEPAFNNGSLEEIGCAR